MNYFYKVLSAVVLIGAACNANAASAGITVRTENYARPPYSGATYYLYEKDGQVICTKLETCNKYGKCEAEYKKGKYKDEMDTDPPFDKTAAAPIPADKLAKHKCLTKFGLAGGK